MKRIDNLDHYAERYRDRPETRRAIEHVWATVPEARRNFGGIVSFSRHVNAELAVAERAPQRVTIAELCMQLGGCWMGSPTARGARRWYRRSEQEAAS